MSKPLVGIIMGSDSDWPKMKEATATLDQFGIAYEVTVASAHRVPEKVAGYARSAEERGLRVIIAGAGLAAHLPGVVAAFTVLPVIGVPLAAGAMAGTDSLHAIVQMPPGVPVATVAIDGARNAGILAAQIIGAGDPDLRVKLAGFKKKMAEEVEKKNQRLQAELGNRV